MARLLDGVIDYAGLFPPAKHNMAEAVREYAEISTGPDNWIVDRFVCPATRLGELANAMRANEAEPFVVTVVGTPHETDPKIAVQHDANEIVQARETGHIVVESYEARVAQGEGLDASVAAVAKLPKMVVDPKLEVYLELGWDDGLVDAMHDASSLFESCGFKARTGGVTASDFPSVEQLAGFISECAALEAPFKYTAGLHEPVRYYDEDLSVYRHGFLNVVLAGALAVTRDLNRREIQAVLDIDDPGKFHFGVDDIRVGDHWLEAEQIDKLWVFFGGIGSCSVDEPINGLRRLGLLAGVGA